MASRFGPGVLPIAGPSVADFLDQAQRGFLLGGQLAEQRRQRRWQEEQQGRQRHEWAMEDEDRNQYLRALRAADLAKPGAVSLDAFLGRPEAKKQVDFHTYKDTGQLEFTPRAAGQFYQTPTGAAVVDRTAAAQQTLADYLSRYGAQYRARSMYPTPAEKLNQEKRLTAEAGDEATYRRALQTYPDLHGLGKPTAIRLFTQRQEREFQQQHRTTPRGAGGTTEADRRRTALQRELDSAQRDVQSLEGRPEYGYWTASQTAQRTGQAVPQRPANITQRNFDDWLTRYRRARARMARAQGDVERDLHGGHEAPRPSNTLRPLPPLPDE